MRFILAVLTILLLASGQWISKGAIYGLPFIGMYFGPIGILRNSSVGYSFALLELAFMPVFAALWYLSLLMPPIGSIYIAGRKDPSPQALLCVGISFAAEAVFMAAGLLMVMINPEYPGWNKGARVEIYFFLWPLLLGIFSLGYVLLSKAKRERDRFSVLM